MRTKSPMQLYCRTCGKPIMKYATIVQVHTRGPNEYDKEWGFSRHVYVEKLPQTRAECQALTTKTITAVKRSKVDGHDIGIERFHEWDGETYVSDYFCTNSCAQWLGRAAAKMGSSTAKWRLTQTKRTGE